jgi:hypothetical protein
MATLNYVTLRTPKILFEYTELIQKTPHFGVYKYKHQSGIVFRIPHGVKEDDVCHFFIEHEINLSNTLRTGTLTMKCQITLVPCHMGVFSGFEELKGTYKTNWFDEDTYGEDYFEPDYKSNDNVKKVAPLPINIKTNLYEYLNEILFSQQSDMDVLSKYAVDLGCQKDKLKNFVFVPAPEYAPHSQNVHSFRKFNETKFIFESLSNSDFKLLPE